MEKNINKITGKKIKPETAWINKDGKEFKIQDINDEYLFNICYFMCDGGGYAWFLNLNRMDVLFEEALRRLDKHPEKESLRPLFTNGTTKAIEAFSFIGKKL
jgi:hypothetical protein